MKTYELHAVRNGRWEIKASYTNREEAVFEAKRAVDHNRYPGVRVTEEVFDEDRNLSRTRSVVSYEYEPVLDRSGREEKYIANLRRLRPSFRAERRRHAIAVRQCAGFAASVQSLGSPFLYLAAIVMLGLCSLIALHTAFGV